MRPIKSINDPRYVKAMSHPIRVRLMAILDERTATPNELSKLVGATLGTTAYHVRTLERLVGRILDITGEPRLLDGTPALLERLSHRNPWVDPLNHLQVELLERVRGGAEGDRQALLATISGIAFGLRNTG